MATKSKPVPAGFDTLTIEFDGRPEKVVTQQAPVSFRQYYAVVDAQAAAKWSDRVSLKAAFTAFEPFLVSWDFPQPPNAEGMEEIDIVLAMSIIGTWILEVRNAPRPLALRSSAGDTSPDG